MIRALFFSAFAILGASACSQPCDSIHLCAINSDNTLCDGTAYVTCDAAHANEQVKCIEASRTAVCTPTITGGQVSSYGWSYDNSGR